MTKSGFDVSSGGGAESGKRTFHGEMRMQLGCKAIMNLDVIVRTQKVARCPIAVALSRLTITNRDIRRDVAFAMSGRHVLFVMTRRQLSYLPVRLLADTNKDGRCRCS